MQLANIDTVNILGVGVSAINLNQAVGVINDWVENRQSKYVCVTSVHGIVESQSDPQLKYIHNSAGLVTPDGMPLVWFIKSSGRKHVRRVYGPDLMLAVMRSSVDYGHKHFLYGATNNTLKRLQANLERQLPELQIVGSYAPPFRALTEAEEAKIISEINRSGADVIWIGLSTPKQERWMAKQREQLDAAVIIGVGAAFDFHAGVKRQAPPVIQRSGLEWLFRLVTEPGRLWRRYFRIVSYFIYHAICQRTGLKSYAFEPIQPHRDPAE